MRKLGLLAAAIIIIATSLPALAAGRVALVIGNGAYVNATELPNPSNDARAIADVLQRIGFTVITGTDLDRSAMEGKLREFVTAMRGADTALFYYSGHGLQVNGRNYLVPVDAALEDEASLDFEMIEADKVFQYMGGNDRIALAFLDACRDNPLSRRLARNLGATRSGSVQTGLAAPRTAGTGLFIGFATAPDDVALDGNGQHSPFTEAMLKHLETPGLEINQLMVRVKADVRAATRDDQRPWTNSDLSTEVYLVPGQSIADIPAAVETLSLDEQMWQRIAGSSDAQVLEAFVTTFPDSVHAEEARARIASLSPDPVDPPAKIETPVPVAEKPRFGVEMRNLTDALADDLGLRRGYSVEIVRVMPGSIAEAAGVLAGDILLDLNWQEINDMHEVQLIVAERLERADPEVPVLVFRNGTSIELNASFAPAEAGLRGASVMRVDRGLAVTKVAENSAAALAGVLPGDVLLQLDNNLLADIGVAETAIAARLAEGQGSAFLVTDREGETYTLRLPLAEAPAGTGWRIGNIPDISGGSSPFDLVADGPVDALWARVNRDMPAPAGKHYVLWTLHPDGRVEMLQFMPRIGWSVIPVGLSEFEAARPAAEVFVTLEDETSGLDTPSSEVVARGTLQLPLG